MLKIKELCKERNMPLSKLAEELHVTPGALSQNIAGRVGLDRLEEIARILGVNVKDLFEDEGISGFIKAKGTIYEIKSRSDIENLLKNLG